MLFDLEIPVMQLCAAGMQVDGEPAKANLAESYRLDARFEDAEKLVQRGLSALDRIPDDAGYTQFVRAGLNRLLERLNDR